MPAFNGGWAVMKGSSDRVSRLFQTKEEAEEWGRMQSIKERSELVIHRRDGTVAGKSSPRDTSQPPRDRK